MSIKWTLPTLILFLCASGALQANPLDSPGIVYIDGLPCNRACQSYMAASDRALSARHREERERIVVVPVEAEVEIVEHAARPRAARQPMPVPRPPRAGMAASNTKASHTKRPPPPGSQANRPARKFRQSRRSCLQKKPRLHRGARSANCKAPPRREPPAKPDVAAAPATTGIAALPAAAGAAPALAPQAEGASVAAATPAEPAKSEVRSPDAVKSEAAAPPPAGSEITVPPATLEIAALPAEAGVARALPARTIQQQVLEATGIADRVTAITLAREAGQTGQFRNRSR